MLLSDGLTFSLITLITFDSLSFRTFWVFQDADRNKHTVTVLWVQDYGLIVLHNDKDSHVFKG